MEKQLDLFEGVILTQEQEQMVTEFIADQDKRVDKAVIENKRIQAALVEAALR